VKVMTRAEYGDADVLQLREVEN